ncbi:hypothetical protein N7468_001994 [Penicillium chermesinum]|uniref:Uncharacterized protein n=1 Tax=Penicillium chermesinum TaxID=63820 RepID=A0A9W9TX34_9EURO|nr:uncharacterized protein N7468_001994 [Penicillium chermesinum]KAJ5247011.1 hypothetical protein N7468_001994 [Penicillium chermesinum]
MTSRISFALGVAALAGLSQLAYAQTNITSSHCISSSEYLSCNRDVADKWGSCVDDCNGNGNCIVDCGCTAHQKYINCMAESCWNQVYSCEYQLFVQQYFAVCPSATEPIPFWPAPDNAPNRCSCDLGKVLQNTLSARNAQVNCVTHVTDQTINNIPTNLGDLGNIGDITKSATECACCGASASISSAWDVCPDTVPRLAGADLWPVFFPSDWPNLYNSVPDFVWGTCDNNFSPNDCKKYGFNNTSDKFYKPGDFPNNGTKTLSNLPGTVTAPPSGTVLTWSQSSTTYTVTATGYDQKAVASQSEYRATATSTDAFATQTSTNGAVGVKPVGVLAFLGVVAAAMVM